MALRKLILKPGVNTQATQTLNQMGWFAGNLIRFFGGLLQKIGGWTQLTATQVTGKSRGMHAFQDLSGNNYLLFGSSTAAQVYSSGTIYTFTIYGITHRITAPFLVSTLTPHQITVRDFNVDGLSFGQGVRFDSPVWWFSDLGNAAVYPTQLGTIQDNPPTPGAFSILVPSWTGSVVNDATGGYPPSYSTTAGQTNVTVQIDGHGLIVGNTYVVNNSVTVGGITLLGPYTVKAVGSVDTFEITPAQVPITSDGVFEFVDSTGQPAGQISYQSTIPGTVKNWSFDNFGQIALLCWQNGPILYWQPPVTNLSVLAVPNAPTINTGMFVAMPQAQIIAFGCEVNGVQDELLIAWSDAGNQTVWTADATNQAGTFRLSRGSHIVGGIQAPQLSLMWTDIDLWAMQYVGPPFIYSFNILQTGCGLLAQRARTTLFGETYWISQKQFFQFGSGGVSVLPCDVWDYIFGDLDPNNTNLVWMWSNAQFNEVWCFFPSASGGTGEVDSYVIYNVVDRGWTTGRLDRTAGIDQSIFGGPIATDTSRILQQHESGYDANGTAMSGVYVESGFVDLGDDGSDIFFVDQIIPDFKWFGTNGYCKVTIYAQAYPGSPTITYGPYTVNPSTRIISLRMRARLIAYRIDWGQSKGFNARLGATSYRAAKNGRRP